MRGSSVRLGELGELGEFDNLGELDGVNARKSEGK